MNSKNNTPSIFKNPLLEFFTKTTIYIHLCWYFLISTVFVFLGFKFLEISMLNGFLLVIIGFFTWTLLEYLMHRFVFHFINENKFVQRFHFIFHGIHHENPKDEQRTMMPPIPGLLISSMYFGILFLLFRWYASFITAGIIFGYLVYSSLHYAIHKYNAPKGLESLWHHHLLHHYQQDDKAFGVSSKFWDHVFRTMPK